MEDAKKDEKFQGDPVAVLKQLEVHLGEVYVRYQMVNAERAEGHPLHAAHNNHGVHAARELGRAHGSVVQAIAALEAFSGKHKTAEDAHDAAEDAKLDAEEAAAKAAAEVAAQ